MPYFDILNDCIAQEISRSEVEEYCLPKLHPQNVYSPSPLDPSRGGSKIFSRGADFQKIFQNFDDLFF